MSQLPRSPVQRAALARQLTPGHGGGRSAIVAPEPRPLRTLRTAPTDELVPIANAGAMATGRSTPYYVRRDRRVRVVLIAARTAGSGDSTFQLRVGGTLTGDVITLPSGDNTVEVDPGVDVPGGTVIDLEALTVGAGLADVGGHIALMP